MQEAVNKRIPQLKEELRELSGIDMQYRKGGILKLAFSEADKNALRSLISQPSVQWLEADDVRKSETLYYVQSTRSGIY